MATYSYDNEPKLKAYYTLHEACDILHLNYIGVYRKIQFIYDTKLKLPDVINNFKRCVKKQKGQWNIKYTSIPRLKKFVDDIDSLIPRAYNDYLQLKHSTSYKDLLGEDYCLAVASQIIKQGKKGNPKKFRKRYYDLKRTKKNIRKVRKDKLKQIYKEEGL